MNGTSLGEKRVRTEFNPSADTLVDNIKQDTAKCINMCETIKDKMQDSEVSRLASIAQTHFETAAMYAVKAATTKLN